ncbi:hypothetical protein KC326_g14 [Hortaea werneckii]|nr:hypothetical protein KC326_g14 [Hortaea werneckii]
MPLALRRAFALPLSSSYTSSVEYACSDLPTEMAGRDPELDSGFQRVAFQIQKTLVTGRVPCGESRW